jgi:anti-anti-sigma factor
MMPYERRVVSGVNVLTPRKNLVGGAETEALTGAVAQLAAAEAPKIVLDLHRITLVSSLGVEELRRIHRTCIDHNGWLRLACIAERVEDILATMRLHWVFDTFDSVEDAMAAPAHAPTHPRAHPSTPRS